MRAATCRNNTSPQSPASHALWGTCATSKHHAHRNLNSFPSPLLRRAKKRIHFLYDRVFSFFFRLKIISHNTPRPLGQLRKHKAEEYEHRQALRAAAPFPSLGTLMSKPSFQQINAQQRNFEYKSSSHVTHLLPCGESMKRTDHEGARLGGSNFCPGYLLLGVINKLK